MFDAVGVAQNVEHFEAADFWHHGVGNNEVGFFVPGHGQRLFAVVGRYYFVAFCFHPRLINFTEVVVVFDEHYFGHVSYPFCQLNCYVYCSMIFCAGENICSLG